MNTLNRDAALKLAAMGLHVFPCNPDKKPIIKTWEQSATANALQIEATWQSKLHLLPAIPVGAHHLIVIDCDRKKKKDGVAAFTELCANYGIDLSALFVVETPSGGLHFYFRTDTPYGNSPGSLPAGVDVRGVGGYVIAPGATLPDGRAYRIVQGSWDTIPALPEALAAFLREKRPSESTNAPVGQNAGDRERSYAASALASEVAKLSEMREGSGRNAALNQAAHSMGTMDGWTDFATVFTALMNAAWTNGYIAKDGEAAARATIESGYSAGRLKPRSLISDAPKADLSALKPAAKGASLTLLFGSEIQERSIEWLWDQYLPLGCLALLAGVGGVGKSTIAFDLAARVTNGAAWPDGSPCLRPGKVLIWSSEDDPARVIKPRLMAAGANPMNYAIVGPMVNEQGEKRSFDPARDMEQLRQAVNQIGGISLLIIDPIVSAVTGDMNKVNEVRRSLQSTVDFAASTNCVVVGITHFAKGTAGRNAAERVIGSTAFKDLSRVTIVLAKDEESGEHVFTRAKSNYSREGDGFNFGIEVIELGNGIIANRARWGQPLQGAARAILAKVEGDGKGDGDKLRAAKHFLIEVLKNGPAPAKEVLKNAREGFGITEDTLRRAYREIGARPHKAGFDGGWMWSLSLI